MKVNGFYTAQLDGSILDVVFPVCVGDSRISKKWKNITMSWGELAERTASTKRTPETMAEYMAMKRNQQADIKDVGGIVCGELKYDTTSCFKLAGRKTKENILSRSILTFDLDECPAGFNPEPLIREKLPGVAAIGYTTHKHTPQAPRWRVFIPLSEEVTPFRYEGIARYVASVLCMQFMDKTTFQYNRMMYWPSTSSDGKFEHFALEGLPISPGKLLEAHPKLKWEYAWPRHPDEEPVKSQSVLTEKEPVKSQSVLTEKEEEYHAEKPGAPAEKPGIIGAFCRAYPIEEAISTFLGEVYKPEGLGRYTYINGSSSGGLIIDGEGKAYSFHGTDPANTGHSLNAFDLVRIHKFGHLDNGVGGHRGNNLPSYKAMSKWASEDAKVMRLLNREFIEAVTCAATGEVNAELGWIQRLTRNAKGKIADTKANQNLIMLNDPILSHIRYDEFFHRDKIDAPELLNRKNKIIDNGALYKISERFESLYEIKIAENKVADMLCGLQSERAFNPVKDYILSAVWDGEPRLDSLLVKYMHAPDTLLVRAQTRKWMVAAVKRVWEPGCKFDYILVLSGPQGVCKSTFFSLLANGGEFFNESLTFDMKDRELVETLKSGWIFEAPELAGMKSIKEQEKIKSFLSKTQTTNRPAYMRLPEDFKLQGVLAATTNDHTFLSDLSSRKFWIVNVEGDPDLPEKLTADIISKIWAESYIAYKRGEQLYLPRALEKQAREANEEHNTAKEDPRMGIVESYLNYLLPVDWREKSLEARANLMRGYSPSEYDGYCLRRNSISAAEIQNELAWQLKQHDSMLSSQYLNRMLNLLGWEVMDGGGRRKVDEFYGRQRNVYKRPGTNGADEIVTTPDPTNKPYRKDADD